MLIRAVLITAAAGLVVSGAAYWRGDANGWHRREAQQTEADYAQLIENQTTFLADLRANQKDGDTSARLIGSASQTLGGIQNDLTRLSDRLSCPADPDRGRLLDATVDTVNTALATARLEFDGAGAGSAGTAAARNPDE